MLRIHSERYQTFDRYPKSSKMPRENLSTTRPRARRVSGRCCNLPLTLNFWSICIRSRTRRIREFKFSRIRQPLAATNEQLAWKCKHLEQPFTLNSSLILMNAMEALGRSSVEALTLRGGPASIVRARASLGDSAETVRRLTVRGMTLSLLIVTCARAFRYSDCESDYEYWEGKALHTAD